MFEIWSFTGNLPAAISTNETSLSVSATVYAGTAQSNAATKLIRLIKNTAPTVRFLQPSVGTSITVAQDLPIVVEATDDTLSLGTNVELYVNDKLMGSHTITGEEKLVNSLASRSEAFTFHYIPARGAG